MPFPNRIRLPLTLRAPQFIDEQEKFRKANGNTVVLSAKVRKQYEVVTDYLPEKIHERLKIAIAHDIVNIEGEKYIGGVTQEGEYTIAWPEFLNYPLGQATFKLEVNNYAARNTNCGTCAEYSQVVCEDDDIGTIGEDETVVVAILYNDAICCSPFEISLVTFNNTYLDSCNIVGNTLELHTKSGIPIQDDVILATYRVTCDNGTFDEANVIADVEGSVEECFVAAGLTLISVTSTTAEFDWGPRPETCGYNWALYLASDLGTPVQSGSLDDSITELELTGLTPSTDYVFFLQRDCCEGSLSPFSTRPFTTQPASETGICGQYELCFSNVEYSPETIASVQYLDCFGNYQTSVIGNFSCNAICALQNSPGDPVYINPLTFDVSVTYIAEC